MRMNTGALQPWPVRHVTTPWPYWAPTKNAPFTMPGTTATHVADLSMLLGTVRSPAPIIWSRTTLAASTRACKSSRVEAAKTIDGSRKLRQIKTQIETMPFFMFISFRTADAASARTKLELHVGAHSFLCRSFRIGGVMERSHGSLSRILPEHSRAQPTASTGDIAYCSCVYASSTEIPTCHLRAGTKVASAAA